MSLAINMTTAENVFEIQLPAPEKKNKTLI